MKDNEVVRGGHGGKKIRNDWTNGADKRLTSYCLLHISSRFVRLTKKESWSM